MPGDGPAGAAEADQLPPDPVRLDPLKRRPADELSLLKLDGPAQASLVRVCVLVHVAAVQAQASLQPAHVPGGQAARFCPGLDQRLPEAGHLVRGSEQLEPVLTGVAGSGDDKRDAGYLAATDSE